MNRSTASPSSLSLAAAIRVILPIAFASVTFSQLIAADALERRASWQLYDAEKMAQMLRVSLDSLGVAPVEMDRLSDEFLSSIEKEDADPLDAFVEVTRSLVPVIEEIASQVSQSVSSVSVILDPNTPAYGALESLPRPMRMSFRTWLGRELVRARLFDEALPVIAEVDPTDSIDPAATLFYRGVCYHALLMKKETLADLRRLRENDEDIPVRYAKTARMMVSDIQRLKEDSLDEISRMMNDVTRRLELGRTDEKVKKHEQEIIDKLSKIIDKAEKQQQQQQQQQQQSADGQGGSNGGQDSPMEDSRIAGAQGSGDVDRKNVEQMDKWGNLPPAERQQALQQISRDLPTHYREAIEAYFRKLATDNN